MLGGQRSVKGLKRPVDGYEKSYKGGEIMRKICSLGLMTVFLLSSAALHGLSQTADEVRAKMIEAMGGEEVLKKGQDITISGTAELTMQGLSGMITIYKKEPNKRRLDFEVMGMIITQAYDGETGWMINPQTGAVEDMPEQMAAEWRRESMPIDSLLNPQKYGVTYTYKGKEQVEGRDHFVLEQTYPDGFQATIYLDSQTYLITKSMAMVPGQMGDVEVEQFNSDYKKVSGLTMAHSSVQYRDGEEFLKLTIEEVKVNTGLEDSLFEREK
jgi:outer membrane lipoprotein-sorting protein